MSWQEIAKILFLYCNILCQTFRVFWFELYTIYIHVQNRTKSFPYWQYSITFRTCPPKLRSSVYFLSSLYVQHNRITSQHIEYNPICGICPYTPIIGFIVEPMWLHNCPTPAKGQQSIKTQFPGIGLNLMTR